MTAFRRLAEVELERLIAEMEAKLRAFQRLTTTELGQHVIRQYRDLLDAARAERDRRAT